VKPYRVGGHWGVTIVREGVAPPDETGHRPDALLLGVAQTKEWARRIVDALNREPRNGGPFPSLADVGGEPVRLVYSVAEAAVVLGISRTKMFGLLEEGRVRTVRVGRRRLVPAAAIDEFLEGE
jgi:excisionase family DNA binding protein